MSVPGAPIVDAPRHRGGLLGLAAAVLLLHAWLLGGMLIAWPGAATEPLRALPVSTRRLDAVRAPPVAAPPPQALATLPAVAAAPRPRPRPETALAPPEPAPPVAPLAEAPAPPPEPDTAGDLPLYRTELPPPATLRYEMTLGRLAGTGTLRWAPDGDRYTASFEGRIAGLVMLGQASSGALGAHGLEPGRFTDRRPRRGERAINFDAEAGKVTFSGPSTVLDRHPGMQDRLSWMLQLAAIVAAEPKRLAEGEAVSLHLIGLRGDAGVWVLRSAGAQTVETPSGAVDTVRFVREPHGPYDTAVELWLAATPPHWPVRAVMGNGTEAGAFEWVLQEALKP